MSEDNGEATKSVEELQAQVDELQQKLNMAESAIDDEVGELRSCSRCTEACEGGRCKRPSRSRERKKGADQQTWESCWQVSGHY
jgi:hypothetical protein